MRCCVACAAEGKRAEPRQQGGEHEQDAPEAKLQAELWPQHGSGCVPFPGTAPGVCVVCVSTFFILRGPPCACFARSLPAVAAWGERRAEALLGGFVVTVVAVKRQCHPPIINNDQQR